MIIFPASTLLQQETTAGKIHHNMCFEWNIVGMWSTRGSRNRNAEIATLAVKLRAECILTRAYPCLDRHYWDGHPIAEILNR